MRAGEVPPPARVFWLERRQLLACLALACAGFLAARGWLLPRWIERAEAGKVSIAGAMNGAMSDIAGSVLACLGTGLLACNFYNRIRHERQRRADAARREIAFVTSLGNSRYSPLQPNDPSGPR